MVTDNKESYSKSVECVESTETHKIKEENGIKFCLCPEMPNAKASVGYVEETKKYICSICGSQCTFPEKLEKMEVRPSRDSNDELFMIVELSESQAQFLSQALTDSINYCDENGFKLHANFDRELKKRIDKFDWLDKNEN